jgi:DNA (cytosine-5)-methyltransferase 1
MSVYYNEHDPYAAQWLRNLIQAGWLPAGDVDERDIREVKSDDLREYTQCHFFAGIGGWPYALRLAGVPDDYPLWTGSPPCQPFSNAGKQLGKSDERHLWPVFFDLIRQCRPTIVFGEQVESAIAHGWLDDLQNDMEGEGYACGATCLPACSVGSPHIRQRLFWSGVWLGNTTRYGCQQQWTSASVALQGHGSERTGQHAKPRQHGELSRRSEGLGCFGVLADANGGKLWKPRQIQPCWKYRQQSKDGSDGRSACGRTQPETDQRVEPDAPDSFWRDSDWIFCRDGRWRSVEPELEPLADGLPTAVDGRGSISRVGTLKGFGNAIVPQAAQIFIETVFESIGELNDRAA